MVGLTHWMVSLFNIETILMKAIISAVENHFFLKKKTLKLSCHFKTTVERRPFFGYRSAANSRNEQLCKITLCIMPTQGQLDPKELPWPSSIAVAACQDVSKFGRPNFARGKSGACGMDTAPRCWCETSRCTSVFPAVSQPMPGTGKEAKKGCVRHSHLAQTQEQGRWRSEEKKQFFRSIS